MIPCGKCDGCAADRALEWAIRIHNEAQGHERNAFLTLTYKEAPDSLKREHLQTFLKRVRHHSKRPVRYFACGEYGEKTRRPHYHMVLFGEDFLGGAKPITEQLYSNPILDGLWGHGFANIGSLTPASAAYTAGYCNKKLNDPDTFSLMSRRPPLGREWLKRNYREVIARKTVIMDGQEYPIPSVYVKWLGLTDLIEERRELAKEKCLTAKQNLAREAATISRKQFKRETI